MCGQSVHERLRRMNSIFVPDRWTRWQLQMLKEAYQRPRPDLKTLQKMIGKHRANICRKARSLGLTNPRRMGLSKYRISETAVRELFQEFVRLQPITMRVFAEQRMLWPHGLSKLFSKHGLLEKVKQLAKDRLKRPDFILHKFEKCFVKEDGCWIWNGCRDRGGYGRFNAFGTSKAHRVSYELYWERPPRDLLICHHCDNPPCVNPAHLFIGTSKDNAQDSVRKGRHGRMRYAKEVS